MGKNLNDTLDDDDFFRFQQTQAGVARKAIRDHARESALARPKQLRSDLANAVREATGADARNDSATLAMLQEKIKGLREAIKRADGEYARFHDKRGVVQESR